MERFLNKMERKFGRYALPNLTIMIIGTYILGYVLQFTAGNVLAYLLLDPAQILHGQVWRLLSWILIPPGSFEPLVIITLWFYYSVGMALERAWGSFRYNVYIFSGLFFTVLGAFVLYAVNFLVYGGVAAELNSAVYSVAFSTYYISLSIMLAFAITYPNMQVLLMFIIPIKIKWLGILYVAYVAYDMVKFDWGYRIVIISSLLNALIYFLATRNLSRVRPSEVRRRQTYRRQARRVAGVTKHKCAICGRTEVDSPDLEFRFCSKCEGNYEYCQEHLFTHEHKKYS